MDQPLELQPRDPPAPIMMNDMGKQYDGYGGTAPSPTHPSGGYPLILLRVATATRPTFGVCPHIALDPGLYRRNATRRTSSTAF